MDILSLLDLADWVEGYEIQDYRQWENGRYYRLKIRFIDESTLFVREYVDETERDYAFHSIGKTTTTICLPDGIMPLITTNC